MNVISIDPGIACTGLFTVIDDQRRSRSISTDGLDGDERLVGLWAQLNLVLADCGRFDIAFIEDYLYHSPGSLSARKSAEAGGVIRLALAQMKIPLVAVPIQTWKALTIGDLKKRTKAEQRAYQRAVEQMYGVTIEGPDAADAFLIYAAARLIYTRRMKRTATMLRLYEEIAAVVQKKGEP
ncbi:MAG: hypothetical protein WC683_04305 [bacterium]